MILHSKLMLHRHSAPNAFFFFSLIYLWIESRSIDLVNGAKKQELFVSSQDWYRSDKQSQQRNNMLVEKICVRLWIFVRVLKTDMHSRLGCNNNKKETNSQICIRVSSSISAAATAMCCTIALSYVQIYRTQLSSKIIFLIHWSQSFILFIHVRASFANEKTKATTKRWLYYNHKL